MLPIEDKESQEFDPIKEMFVQTFMAPGFLVTEPGRIFTRAGAEKLYDLMMKEGSVNLGREDIERLTQGFGSELFRGIDQAQNN